jgi:hypothetical protein
MHEKAMKNSIKSTKIRQTCGHPKIVIYKNTGNRKG